MHVSQQAALRRLADSVVFRHVADVAFRARARREIARLDRLEASRSQRRILLGLVHAARATPFGREHDFHRIHTEADFRRLVPLRTPVELQRSPSSAVNGRRAVWHAGRAAWETALAFATGARPGDRLLSGALMFLEEGDPSAVAELPRLVRPWAVAVNGDALGLLARPAMTCLAGPAVRIASLLDDARRLAGGKQITDLWPSLTAILCNRSCHADDAAPRLREAVGDKVLLLETCFLPQGPAAVEDPRRGCLRLLCDHGVYLEFTPAAEAGKPDAARHGPADVEPGVVYELAMTSPAGAWACRTGLAVRFERRDPPLLRLAEMPAPAAEPVRQTFTRPACPPPAPHPQIAGIPAAPPEKLAHTLWSAPADRG